MINRQALLSDLQSLLKRLEADLLERSESAQVPDVGRTLRAEYDHAKRAERTAQNYEDWRSDYLTQTAAAWVLSCVFVRFLEDNRLTDPPTIAGPKERLRQARDEHTIYFQDPERAKLTDREYLFTVFDELATLPGTKDVFGEHNPIRELPNWLSGDAAGEMLRFFQKIDANTGDLVHDFTDPNWDTRFLGDLYQDLSEAARKKYALLQTPEFVEEFILDRTLDPALEEFGLDAPPVTDNLGKPITAPGFRMIDPACGSGHFLLGAFPRILDRWQKQQPDGKMRDLVQKTLDGIHGVDVNPYAIAIARFRLLLAALKACGITKLRSAPAFAMNLVCGDSLYHGWKQQQMLGEDWTAEAHYFRSEDANELQRVLREGTYHCVVANPPYITPKDRAANRAYRRLYSSCHMKYSLAVPFLERIFKLAVAGGFTGQITANSFMKREFGKKLIETFLPTVDLTHVIDTSGAYIPGHGTPTVILFGRNRPPVASTLRTVMGIRGEPATPDDPAQGLVWSAIGTQIDHPGSQSEFVSIGDSSRELFHKHPWSIGGGGAAELKERMDASGQAILTDFGQTAIGLVTLEDEAYAAHHADWLRRGISQNELAGFVEGDRVRDWQLTEIATALFPHDWTTGKVQLSEVARNSIWPLRTGLAHRTWFRKTQLERGLEWFEYGMLSGPVTSTPLSIVYAEVATHNHFVLDRGNKVFKQTAPVIKLPPDATEDDHLGLLGLLNSSVACFWMKQVCHNKGSTIDQHGARQRTAPFEDFYAFNGTKLQQLPLPEGRPLALAKHLDELAQQLTKNSPAAAIARWGAQPGPELAKEHSLRQCLDDACIVTTLIQGEMLLVQEDLDWECYRLYGLIDEDLTVRVSSEDEDRCILPGNRAFEIVLARKLAAGEAQSTWFERHDMIPNTELPDPAFNAKYREIVARRIGIIETNSEIALIEQPEYKRRWNWEPWDSQQERALRIWLLNRLESYFDFDGRMNDRHEPTAEIDISLISVAKLADIADQDPEFHQVGAALQGDLAFDIPRLVSDLVASQCVPLLPILRYKPSGLRKRKEWERTWELQRREDAGEEVGEIPVPPKYKSSDFISTGGARFWALRGKLDVPKERWISFPHCEGPDGTLVICWAGYDHLQQARAISAYFVDIQERLGGRDDPRLVPLLAGVIELLPWLKQWHNALDPEYNQHMDEVFEGFVTEEAKNLGMTVEEIRAWEPPVRTSGRRRRSN